MTWLWMIGAFAIGGVVAVVVMLFLLRVALAYAVGRGLGW